MFRTQDSKVECNGIKRNVINGRPFILVSEKKLGSDEDMFAAWQNGELGVKVVYLLPPELSLQEYMERTIKFIEDPSSNTKPGNDTTSFHILNELRKGNLQLLKDKLNRIYSKRPQKVDEVLNLLSELDQLFEEGKRIREQDPSQRIYADFIQKLTEIGESGTPLNQELDVLLRRVLDKNSGTYNPIRVQEDEHTTELYLDLIQKVSDVISETYVIYDRVRYDPDSSDLVEGIAHAIKSDARNPYRINGKYLLLDCRVTPPTFGTQELNGFVDSVVNYHIHEPAAKGKPLVNSTTGNTQFDIKLHNEFTRTKVDTSKKSYTPSKKFTQLVDHLNSLGINYNYKTPENSQEEKTIIDGIINKINTDNSVKAVVYVNPDGNIRHIDYSGSELETIVGSKKFSGNTLEIGDRKFIVEINNNKATFTEEIAQQQQNNQPISDNDQIASTFLATNRDVMKFISLLNRFGEEFDTNKTVGELRMAIDNLAIENINSRQRPMVEEIIENIHKLFDEEQNPDQSECNKITLDIK